MENLKKNNGFIITCIACIVLLVTLTYFGINSSVKETYSAGDTATNCSNIKNMDTCRSTPDCSVNTVLHDDGVCKGPGSCSSITVSGNCLSYPLCSWEPNVWTEEYCYHSGGAKTCEEVGYYSTESAAMNAANCKTGYYNSPINPTNGKVCITATCTSCNDGYTLNSGKCVKDTGSSSCPSGTYSDESAAKGAISGTCASLHREVDISASGTEGCFTAKCGVCLSGYEEVNGVCQVKSGSGSGTKTCAAGTYYNGNGGCANCEAGHYCAGGTFGLSSPNGAGRGNCPEGTTSPANAISIDQCTASTGSGAACWVCSGQYVWGNGTGCSYKATWKTQANCSGTVTSGGGGTGTGGGSSTAGSSTGTGGSTTNNTGNNNVGTGGNNNNNNTNVNNNPQTGSIFIFVVWVIGFAAIGYSVYYFKSIKNSNN